MLTSADSLTLPSSGSPTKMPPTIFQLPAELLFMICSMLPVSSQACLALTCKTYYTQFKSVFRDEFFDSPDPDSEPLGPWTDDKVKPDWKLFRKFIAERELERGFFSYSGPNQILAFLSSCRKLHPKHEFEDTALNEKDENRHCKWPGIVIFSSRIQPIKPITNVLHDADRSLPWQCARYLPEFGLDRTPWIAVRLE
jgi:hypothetical protein